MGASEYSNFTCLTKYPLEFPFECAIVVGRYIKL